MTGWTNLGLAIGIFKGTNSPPHPTGTGPQTENDHSRFIVNDRVEPRRHLPATYLSSIQLV